MRIIERVRVKKGDGYVLKFGDEYLVTRADTRDITISKELENGSNISLTMPWSVAAEYIEESKELVPERCPHCNGECVTLAAEYKEFPEGESGYYVMCKGCNARTGYHVTKEGAVKSWNRRVNMELEKSKES